MSKPVITVEDLGKAYYLGQALDRHATIREKIASIGKDVATRVRQKFTEVGQSDDAFWAVRHANFEVNRGEVLGLVGRNGAGKSTLLKVLSRITEPTEGRAVIRGRVASLLEVGTGFHPELTGRENIYLNGAILGMSKREIKAKFDEIVAFSEVEKFLDTPVKRYSSGMYVRLAFAVAAHLEPEVLIVDEVLAVGDQAFQKKCLGKMGDVVREGRTVLFVSHNMDAVTNLCTHVVLCKNGLASERLTPDEGVRQYLALSNEGSDIPLAEKPRTQQRPRKPVFTNLRIQTDSGHDRVVATGGRVTFEIEVSDCSDIPSATCGVALSNNRGQRVAFFHTLYHSGFWFGGTDKAWLTCTIPSLPLVPASYHVDLVMADDRGWIEKVDRADKIEVVFADVLGTGKIPSYHQGLVVLPCDWAVDGAPITERVTRKEATDGTVHAGAIDELKEEVETL
jgi:lipopolysaccharide transport system ATP-binding protein